MDISDNVATNLAVDTSDSSASSASTILLPLGGGIGCDGIPDWVFPVGVGIRGGLGGDTVCKLLTDCMEVLFCRDSATN